MPPEIRLKSSQENRETEGCNTHSPCYRPYQEYSENQGRTNDGEQHRVQPRGESRSVFYFPWTNNTATPSRDLGTPQTSSIFNNIGYKSKLAFVKIENR